MLRVVLLLLTAMVALSGCAAPRQITDRSDFLAEAIRNYPSETRERVIAAAQTVLKLSDPDDFEFRNTLTGFTGLRRYFIYAVLASATGREKWDFTTEVQQPGVIQASVAVSEAGTSTGGYSTTPYEGQMASIPLYRLFWSRVDYVLGRSNTWTTCDQAAEALDATKTNSVVGLSGLCGGTSNGRDAPAPPQMAPMKAVASVAPQPSAPRRR
jgi:hypothetical protein